MKRITLLATLLQGYEVVCDIGTDHGYVLREAFDKGFIKQAIVGEIAVGPLESAKKTLSNYPVTFYLSDGFDKIKESFDIGLISGMGVYTIIDILSRAPKAEFLLQPNDKHEILRKYLSENNYQIVDEYITFDKFYYIIIHVKKGDEKLSPGDLYLGPKLKDKNEAQGYYFQKLNHLKMILQQADAQTKKELTYYIELLEGVIK